MPPAVCTLICRSLCRLLAREPWCHPRFLGPCTQAAARTVMIAAVLWAYDMHVADLAAGLESMAPEMFA